MTNSQITAEISKIENERLLADKEKLNREFRTLEIVEARRKLFEFTKFTMKDYRANWHHEVICEYLQAFIEGEITKLMVWVGPQYGKSELTSRRLGSFLPGYDPNLRIALTSYAADLAVSLNRDIKRIIQTKEYALVFPDTRISSKRVKTAEAGDWLNNANIFEIIEHKGSVRATGVGGPLSGFPVDVLLIDDPVKDDIQGASLTDQENKWNWYLKVARARLHKDSKQLITMTRWDKGDLCGRILEAFPNGWEVLKLEAIKQTKTYINPNITGIIDPRKFGDALWPERHAKQDILDLADADPATYNSLYQQDPKTDISKVYATGFKYGRIVREISYKKSLPLHYTVDFNTSPYMTGLVAQLEWITDDYWNGYGAYWELSFIDKFALKAPINDAQSLGREFEARYPVVKGGFILYGDASGNSNTGIASPSGIIKTKTLFSDLLDGLSPEARNNCQKRIPKSNPRYMSIGPGMLGRRVHLNKVLSGAYPVKVVIDPKCSELVEDLQICRADANGKLAKPKTKGGVEMNGHMLQAKEYLICHPDALGYLARKKK